MHGVVVETEKPTSEGHRVWPINALGCLLKVDSIILTRDRSPWSNSQWPQRAKGQSFYHMVLLRKGTLREHLVILPNSLLALKAGITHFRENTRSHQRRPMLPARMDPIGEV